MTSEQRNKGRCTRREKCRAKDRGRIGRDVQED
jgi:hypothetical protein